MILSVSRRTDIPNYYSEWFFNRLKEGCLYVRNPINSRQVSKITLSPEVTDCIVFWTKNPKPMLSRLEELHDYKYYFQFTLTGFGRDIEPGILHKKTHMIPVFQELSEKIGSEKVIWRYDPILFTDRYTPSYHLKAFEQIAQKLHHYTSKCVISFVDLYIKNQKNLRTIRSFFPPKKELADFAEEIALIAHDNNIKIASCAEEMDLSSLGIEHNCCIDKELIERITGYKIQAGKDKNQREKCGCIESIDVGAYHTCKSSCLYCYANYSPKTAARNYALYNPHSPILCGNLAEQDKITERKMKSLAVKTEQIFMDVT